MDKAIFRAFRIVAGLAVKSTPITERQQAALDEARAKLREVSALSLIDNLVAGKRSGLGLFDLPMDLQAPPQPTEYEAKNAWPPKRRTLTPVREGF